MNIGTSAPREAWLDVAKGLGIISVVVAHVFAGTTPGNPVTKFLYLFHMPLFFMISGYLQSPMGTAEFIKRKSQSLLVPYAVYLAILSAPALAMAVFSGDIIADLWRTVFGGQLLTGRVGVFWFVTCLFTAQVVFNLILQWDESARTVRSLLVLGALGALGYAFASWHLITPWAIGIAPMAVLFLWSGYSLKLQDSRGAWAIVIGAVSLGATAVFWPLLSFDMKAMDYGVPVISLILAAALSIGVFFLARKAAAIPVLTRILAQLGQASLVIMFLHQAVWLTARRFMDSPAILIVLAIGVPVLVHLFARRFRSTRRFLLGMPPRRDASQDHTPLLAGTSLRSS